jgi:predicted transcriptional regulator
MAAKPTAYDLFKRDFDTQQIAEYLGISEAAALKSLTPNAAPLEILHLHIL